MAWSAGDRPPQQLVSQSRLDRTLRSLDDDLQQSLKDLGCSVGLVYLGVMKLSIVYSLCVDPGYWTHWSGSRAHGDLRWSSR